ncbi:PorT family protein [Formosa sediminum]|uniref:PorT family protein n=1 Tax=Formosa sediminum TaxID=2594004 RepID=A0A516GS14_9FLAO|nr:outer membrane beta-barrel protein [Formosa sediminum]QDO94160.1 PorT family protein [Formosa sediminum]
MKNLIFILFVTLGAIQITTAQSGSGYGIKGGLNYSSNGNYISSIGDHINHSDRNIGFHLGVFAKFGSRLYFKPELMYTQTSSAYDNADLEIKKIDLPALVGIRLIGPLSVFAGPSFQYILDSKFDDIDYDNIEEDISMGLNFGLALHIRRIGIDLRYERGFNTNETEFITNNGLNVVTIDSRPDQLILSLSLSL